MFKKMTLWMLALSLVVAYPVMAEDKAKTAETKKEEPKKGDAKAPEATKAPETKPAAAATTPAAGATVGKAAPDFAGKDLKGKDWNLAAFKGKITVLEWFNDQCPVCARHCKAGTVNNTMKKFDKDKDKIAWVFVNSTSGADARKADIEKYLTENKLTTPVLMDPDGKIGKAYGAKTTPHIFVIDQKGNIAYMGAIDDDKEGKGAKTNYVEQAIDALLKGTTPPTTTTEPYGCSVKYKG